MPFGPSQPGRLTQKRSSACLGSPRTKSQPGDLRRKERRELRVFRCLRGSDNDTGESWDGLGREKERGEMV